MNRRSALPLLGGLLALPGRSRACLWDSNTLKDELASNPEPFDLILGQFPHHGDTYYQFRRERLEKKADLDLTETNDLAVALVRLKEYEKGLALLESQLKKNPTHYETLSNIGVASKNPATFRKAPPSSKRPSPSNQLATWALATGILKLSNGAPSTSTPHPAILQPSTF